MYFLCIAIWQLLVQQQSNMQNLAKTYPKNHIKDTCNTDSETEKKAYKESFVSCRHDRHRVLQAGKRDWEIIYPYVLHVFILQSSHKSFYREGRDMQAGFQRTQILYPVKCLFLRSISTFAMLWKHSHFPNFRKAGGFFSAVMLYAKGISDKGRRVKELISTNTVSKRETATLTEISSTNVRIAKCSVTTV